MAPFQSNVAILWMALLFTLACVTDWVDGWMARRFGLVSDLGKVLDPLADKILVLVFLPLLQMQVIHFFPVFIIFAREFAVMGLRVLSAKRGHNVASEFTGKLKTAVTLPVCGILFARVSDITILKVPKWLMPLEWLRIWILSWPAWVVNGLVWLTVAVTIISFLDYIFRFFWARTLDKAKGDSQVAKRRLLIVIPNALTLLNMACGILAIYKAWNGFVFIAAGLVLLGIYLDALDGRLARKFDVFSRFGASLDSKADFVSFGIAPAVILYHVLGASMGPRLAVGALIVGLFYYASVHFRLRRFNKTGHSDFFEGLPSPTGAGVIAVASTSNYLNSPTILIPLALIISGLMVSTIPYPHLGHALKHPLFKAIKYPALLFFLLTVAAYLGARQWIYWNVGEIFLVFVAVYVLYPLYAARVGPSAGEAGSISRAR